MGSSELGVGAQIVRVAFIVINAIFLALGLLDIAIGIWLVVQADEYNDAESITGENVTNGGILLIVSGVITVALFTVGLLGGILKNRPLLIIFVIILTIIVLLQIVTAILGFVTADEISDDIEDNLNDAVRDYRFSNASDFDETSNEAVDYLQDEFDCCGSQNANDYAYTNSSFFCANEGPPASCLCDAGDDDCMQFNTTLICDGTQLDVTFYAWDEGCFDKLEDIYEAYSFIVGIVGLIIAIFEIVGIVLAIVLCGLITVGVRRGIV